ncbi:ABC transporter permease subunit [Periweissella cryptocerci]|uniref:ABC transporter permease subunit n=1 Tax=Periweissella cryptocerci TaxID=2506420 RepID=A0A4P6YX81_9LACO|nr:ABC transporter permease subunit [Periweissella cryptocerci]
MLITLVWLMHNLLPNRVTNFEKPQPYFNELLIIALVVTAVFAIISTILHRVTAFQYNSPRIGVFFLAFGLYDLVTLKLGAINTLFFPNPDKIFGAMVNNAVLLAKCLGYSVWLLVIGWVLGGICGVITGILIGWSTDWNYWLDPIVKFLGPIPPTVLIPIALSAFPTSFAASAFLLALSMWFPVTILTNSGIASVRVDYLEVADTMGASTLQKVFKVAIPAAAPSIFVGIFNGVCASFITLMVAEMLGVRYGLGWYINWQREIMGYANVYAGLIVLAIAFSLIITILFRVRDHFLKWQEGLIKW